MQTNINHNKLSIERMESLLRGVITYIIRDSNELQEAKNQLEDMGFSKEEYAVLGFPESNEENKILLLYEDTETAEQKETDHSAASIAYQDNETLKDNPSTLTESQNNIILTTHSRQRMKERCGLQKKSKVRIAERAFEKGITPEETNGSLRKWITAVFYKNTDINNIRLYGDKVYLFADKTLVTVLFIPKHLQVRVNRIAQKKKAIRKDA